MQKLLLFYIRDKRFAKISFVFIVFLQIGVAYALFMGVTSNSNLTHIMFSLIVLSAFMFSLMDSLILSLLGDFFC